MSDGRRRWGVRLPRRSIIPQNLPTDPKERSEEIVRRIQGCGLIVKLIPHFNDQDYQFILVGRGDRSRTIAIELNPISPYEGLTFIMRDNGRPINVTRKRLRATRVMWLSELIEGGYRGVFNALELHDMAYQNDRLKTDERVMPPFGASLIAHC